MVKGAWTLCIQNISKSNAEISFLLAKTHKKSLGLTGYSAKHWYAPHPSKTPGERLLARQLSVKWGKVDFCSSLQQILDGTEVSCSDSLFFPESFYTFIGCISFLLKPLRILISEILYLQCFLSYLACLYGSFCCSSSPCNLRSSQSWGYTTAVSELGLGSSVTGSSGGGSACQGG